MILPAVLLVGALAGPAPAAAARPAGKGDVLHRLEADPSAAASARLKRLLAGTKDADQRFWLVQALGVRLRAHRDEAALETLLAAAADPVPLVRGSAVRGLAAFDALPPEAVRARWLERLDAAAHKAQRDPAPAVREGAKDLGRALSIFRDPAARGGPPPPEGKPTSRYRLFSALGLLWLIALPLSVGVWLIAGCPLFASGAEGRRAAAAAAELARRRGLLFASGALWSTLAVLLVAWGFDLLTRFLGAGPEPREPVWPAYLSAWFCLVAPAAFAAAAVARDPEGDGFMTALEAAPQAALLSVGAALALGPAELLYRVLWRAGRRAPPAPGSLACLLEEGAVRASSRAAAAMAEEGAGLLPALKSAGPAGSRLAMTCYDARFVFLVAAPAVTGFCALAAAARGPEWGASRASVALGCALWAWLVLIGLLAAVLAALEGVAAGARHRAARGLPNPAPLRALTEEGA